MDSVYNFLLQLIFIGIGIYFLISTYKKPALWYSTNLRGYLAGIFFLILGLLSLFGKYSILEVLRSWDK